MKVLHVVPDIAPESGGQSAAAVEFCKGLAGEGVEVSLLTTDYGMDREVRLPGIDLHVVPCAFSHWRWSPAFDKTLKALLAQVQVVHLHGLWLYPIWAAGRACRTFGIPYLLRPCGMLDHWSLSQHRWRKQVYALLLERQTIRTAAALHFTTEAEQVESWTFGLTVTPCVVPLGLAKDTYEDLPPRGRFRRRFPELAQRQILLFLGRLHYKKRPDLLLQVFSELALEYPNLALVLAGPGDSRYVSDLQAHARNLNLSGRVVFTGLLQRHAVREVLVDADVFVLPSFDENFGMAVAEAMAAGCPVVVSPQVALAAIIKEYGAGLVVDSTVEDLKRALRQLLYDEERRRAMGQNGRQLILDRFTWHRVVQQIVGVYEDIIRGGTRMSSAWQ